MRTKKTTNYRYTWNGANLAKEQTGDITNIYNYDITGIHSASMNGSLSIYIKDTHGNVIGVTDDTGVIVNNYEYDAFGVQISGDSAPSPFGYCGEYLDNESGLIYLRNRYYDSAKGRFITEDPIKDGLNWYAYCGNEPVMRIDPNGRKFKFDKNATSLEKEGVIAGIQRLTTDEIYINDEGYIDFNIVNDTAKPNGTELIRRMLGDEVDGIITFNHDLPPNNHVSWEAYDDVIKPVVSLYSPLNSCSVGVYDSYSNYLVELFTTDIITGHEFIHVNNALNGEYVPDVGLGAATSKAAYSYKNGVGEQHLAIERTEELNASGIPYFLELFYDENGKLIGTKLNDTNNADYLPDINENVLRKENGYNVRAIY